MQPTTSILLSVIVFMAGCTPFSHLTRVPAEGHDGPQASQCGACHVAQYHEWQGTAHARAFTGKAFQEAAGSPAEEECLQCHSPQDIRAAQLQARSFHQEEGVTCISCHLSQGKMHGPHTASALFTPHPVQEDGQFYQSPALCATCHDETHAQWQRTAAAGKTRSCQECHMPAVQRRATQGTNPVSNLLVSFEDELPTRSHAITLDTMANFPGAVTITALALKTGPDAPALVVTIRNNLPHSLPTGTFGEKEFLLALTFEKEGTDKETIQVSVSDTQHPLASAESKKLIIPLNPAAMTADTLRLDLARHSSSPEHRPPITLSSTIINSIAKAFH
jgi:hypothetical protein